MWLYYSWGVYIHMYIIILTVVGYDIIMHQRGVLSYHWFKHPRHGNFTTHTLAVQYIHVHVHRCNTHTVQSPTTVQRTVYNTRNVIDHDHVPYIVWSLYSWRRYMFCLASAQISAMGLRSLAPLKFSCYIEDGNGTILKMHISKYYTCTCMYSFRDIYCYRRIESQSVWWDPMSNVSLLQGGINIASFHKSMLHSRIYFLF